MTTPTVDFPLAPYDLSRAPELASLALLQGALHICALSLAAEHPTLHNPPAPHDPPSLRRARRLLSVMTTFDRALSRYREAVYRAIAPLPPHPDDLLF